MALLGFESPIEQPSVSTLTAETVDYVFDRLAKEIGRGLTHGAGDATTPSQLRESVRSGSMSGWVVHRDSDVMALIVLSVRKFDAKTVLFVELAAGREMSAWVEQVESLLRDFRVLVGAAAIQALCRDGMARRLTKRWKRKATLMEMR